MDELVAYLHDHAHAEHLRLTTEDAARNEFKANIRQEEFGIDAYMAFKPGKHDWPRDQGEYDTLWTCEDQKTRVQHKSCHPQGITPASCRPRQMRRDRLPRQTAACYDKDDADLIVSLPHEATNRVAFLGDSVRGPCGAQVFHQDDWEESISLRLPRPSSPTRMPREADTWTSAFYTGSLEIRRCLKSII